MLTAVLIGGCGGGSAVPGMPAGVVRQVGDSPTVITVNTSVLAAISPPTVDQLAQLEQRITAAPHVRTAYGPASWLRAKIAAIGQQVGRRTTAKETRQDLLVRYGATGGLSLDDQGLTSELVFGTGEAPVKSLQWLLPSANQIRIFVRTAGGADSSELARELRSLVSAAGLGAVTVKVG